MLWLSQLAEELSISFRDENLWRAAGTGVAFDAIVLGIGVLTARFVGFLPRRASAGETLGVGLSAGLVVSAAWTAVVGSGGRSAFLPVALGLAFALVLAGIRRVRLRKPTNLEEGHHQSAPSHGTLTARSGAVAAIGSVGFLLGAALLYGATLAPSPRDGVQPIDFQDGAFYSVLAVDLQKTGIESTLAPSGLTPPRGSPEQNWYHWGEIWIASAVGDLVDVDPISARHFIVLPALLLAAAALTGTLVRRANRTESRKAFLLGFAACLFLAPIPVLDGGFFNKWAVGLTFGITQFGLGAIVVLLSTYGIVTARTHSDSWRFAAYSGSLMAMIVPAHIVIAALSVSTACGLLALRLIRRLLGHRSLAIIPPPWQRTAICTSVIVGATIVWGVATGHGLGGTAVSENVRSFNFAWAQSLLAVIVGGGILLSIPIAWLFAQVESPAADGYAAIGGTIVLGAIVWGARLGDFNMFYVFFAAVTVFGVPAAAIGIWSLVSRSRRARFTRVALLLSIIAVLQVEVGIGTVVLRLQQFGAGRYDPVPVQVLAAIHELPPPAKVAYRCANNEEISYWVPRLLAIGVRGDHPIIPLCFETDSFSELTGGTRDPVTASPLFLSAPQLDLFPSASANPRPEDVAAWMRAQGIEYIYADVRHPNTLVPEARVVTQVGDFALFQLP